MREARMAEIVFGFGTSHSSQLSLSPEDWPEQAELDKTRTPWDELIPSAPASMSGELAPEVQSERHSRAQDALRKLSEVVEAMRPDVLVIVGDDQDELFPHDQLVPAIALTLTSGLIDRPIDLSMLPPIRQKSMWAMHGEEAVAYSVNTNLSEHVATRLSANGFDIAVMRSQPETRSLGHAWTFIRRRVVKDWNVTLVPIFLNTYFSPNRPTPERCVDLGEAIATAIADFPDDLRVGIVASGGLSHFVIDESLDRRILGAFETGDTGQLVGEDPQQFTSGTSEILNWITVGSALRDFQFELIDYLPAYRSLAGTGCGFAFGVWTPRT
jgi:3-O-methylgallate 3,4-dioxygenase